MELGPRGAEEDGVCVCVGITLDSLQAFVSHRFLQYNLLNLQTQKIVYINISLVKRYPPTQTVSKWVAVDLIAENLLF